MALSKEQVSSFIEAAKPLVLWMRDNVHPNCTAIVDESRAELFESQCAVMPLKLGKSSVKTREGGAGNLEKEGEGAVSTL